MRITTRFSWSWSVSPPSDKELLGRKRLADRDVCDDPPLAPPPAHPPTWRIKQRTSFVGQVFFWASLSPALHTNPIQPKEKKAMLRSTCVCACMCVSGPGVGRSVCLSAKHRFILFLQFISPPRLYDPFRSASRGSTWCKGVVGIHRRLLTPAQKPSNGPGDHSPPMQGHAGQQQTELPAVWGISLFTSAVIGLVKQREG